MIRLFNIVLICLLCGCLSPKYVAPELSSPMPEDFKNLGQWEKVDTEQAMLPERWWEGFQDPVLDGLVEQLGENNQKLIAAAADYQQILYQVDAARSSFFPNLVLPATLSRGDSGSGVQETYSYGLRTTWEINFWNTVPAFKAAKALAESSKADLLALRLLMQAELAQTYFALRAYDVQEKLYASTIETYKKAVEITTSQYRGGIVTPADMAQAEAQLAAAEAELADIQLQRAKLEHALAVLVGEVPVFFNLEKDDLKSSLPSVPKVLPSSLLSRRPDIVASERMVAVANEKIGLARAAWLPSLNLNGEILAKGVGWTAAPTTVWALGPSAAWDIFEGGKRLAESRSAFAGFELAVANFRQVVLQSFQEVEDNLAAIKYLEIQSEAQKRAVVASTIALRLSTSQYLGGLTTYLQVVNTQTTALSNQRRAIHIEAQRRIATVNLIKAVGGGVVFDEEKAEKTQILN